MSLLIDGSDGDSFLRPCLGDARRHLVFSSLHT